MDNVKALYDQFPDQDNLLDFDTFFVGEGSARVVSRVNVDNYYSQVFNKDVSGVGEVEDITDWEDFDGEYKKVENFEELFYEVKSSIFALVNYVEKKFSESKNPMVRLVDLVVTDVDRSFIDYLKYNVDDYNTIKSIATLMAYKELGYSYVRFCGKDGCPICVALNKNVYNIQQALDILSQGNSLSHRFCDCSFEPFGKFYGVCDTIEDGIELINCPIEWKKYVIDKAKKFGYSFVVFEDAERYMKNQKVDFQKGTVAYQISKDGKNGIFIDKSFIGFYSAMDYLDKAEFEKVARLLSREGVDYIDPKDLKGDLYMMKLEDGSTAVVVGYENPISGEYEMRLKDTGELVSVQE